MFFSVCCVIQFHVRTAPIYGLLNWTLNGKFNVGDDMEVYLVSENIIEYAIRDLL